jgi:ActR/RegA family two-component response regulator
MAPTKMLLVDDDEIVLQLLLAVMEKNGFEVKSANNVADALKLISTETFEVLLSDLHMPGAGDGLTVVSAMRHANPKAVTILLSAFPDVNAAAHAILLQADEILVKPMDVESLVKVIRGRLAEGPFDFRTIEPVAAILDREVQSTTNHWYKRVMTEPKLTKVQMSREKRCAHLPQILKDLALRLRCYRPLGSRQTPSSAAASHGIDRRAQGYTAAMLVEESRILQVCIFETLQRNLAAIDFSTVLAEVMTIADEVDSQLSYAMDAYIGMSLLDDLPNTVSSGRG